MRLQLKANRISDFGFYGLATKKGLYFARTGGVAVCV
jgi:hypothetical protein